MVYLAPALLVLAVGLLLAVPLRAATPPHAYRLSKFALLATIAISASAFLWQLILPAEPVENGPIGATCPDTSSTLGHVQSFLVVAAIAAAAVAVAGATLTARRGLASAWLVAGSACVVPYVALVGWLFPRLCDYS